MQKFDDKKGKRRVVNLSNMKEKDAERYFIQCLGLSKELQKQCTEELKQQIKKVDENSVLNWILAINSKDGKLIGKMEIASIDGIKASLRIQIPNENWIYKYGAEAVDQFVKICTENHYFEEIELDPCVITERYIKQQGISSNVIEVA